MLNDNTNQKLSIKWLMLLSLILVVSVSMFSSPTFSSLMYSNPTSYSHLRLQQVYAQNGEDNGESESESESSSSESESER
jgi:hypothetical protein